VATLLKDLTMTGDEPDRYIRGVNLGGWLVLERYIVPYQFSVTDCHVRGDLCWYPQQASAPPIDHPDYQLCDRTVCQPVRIENAFGNMDYPVDEKTLADAFLSAATLAGDSSTTATSSNNNTIGRQQQREIAERWFNYHFENFIKFEDLQKIKAAGITHLRVPLPHWIRGDVREGESWIVGQRWEVFLRLCKWARSLDLQVWPDIHTAPGSQNGFGTHLRLNIADTCSAHQLLSSWAQTILVKPCRT
jgi:glucan 1,3-beta-glucosidase